MAESYSVTARISAKDSGFKSTLDKCSSALDKIDSKLNAFSFGFISEIGRSAFNSITSSIADMVGELSDAGKAWKTFSSNMNIAKKNGIKLEGSIEDIQKDLQDYATDTIYSASDMAQTYAQLAAVGTKDTLDLVKSFGALAAAAEDPAQAMKTLSTQATQMAARPNVAWQDFKLMLEQSPAGMAAVAHEMGMTTSDLVNAIQEGTVATDDFFAAIKRVGDDESFKNLATEYKSVGDAIGGLKETLANKLGPAFEVISSRIIGVIEKIIGKVDQIDSQALADKVSKFLDNAAKYWEACKEAFEGVGDALMEAFSAVGTALTGITGEFGSVKSVESFKSFMTGVADVIKFVAGVIRDNATLIATLIRWLPAIALGIKALKIAKSVAPGIMAFSKGIGSLFGKLMKRPTAALSETATGMNKAGSAASVSGAQMLTSAKSFALMGVAVLAIAAGFALLAQSAIALAKAGPAAIITMAGLAGGVLGFMFAMAAMLKSLSTAGPMLAAAGAAMALMGVAVLAVAVGFALLAQSSIALAAAGGPAIAVMFGLIGALAALMLVAAALGPVLTVGAIGFVAFGAAILMVGAGAMMAAVAVTMLSSVLPMIVQYGLDGATALVALGGALLVFGAGAAVAGAGALVLGAGLLLCATSMMILAAGMAIIGIGALAVAASFAIVAASIPVITALGNICTQVFTKLGMALLSFAPGALAAGAAALALGAGLILVSAQILIIAAGMLMISAAALMAATALQIVSRVLPIICIFGDKGSASLIKLGEALLAFSPGAAAAGAAAALLTVGLLGAGAAALVLGAGLLVVGTGMLLIASTAGIAMLSLQAITKLLPMIAAVGAANSAAILKLGTDFTVFAAQTAAAGVAALAFGAGMLTLSLSLAAAGMAASGLVMAITQIATGSMIAAMSMQIISTNLKMFAQVASQIVNALNFMGQAFLKFGENAASASTEAFNLGTNFALLATSAGAAAMATAALTFAIMTSSASSLVLAMSLAVIATSLNSIRTASPAASAMIHLVGATLTKVATMAVSTVAAFSMIASALMALGTAAFSSSANVVALGGSLTGTAMGAMALVASLFLVLSEMKSIEGSAKDSEKALNNMVDAIDVVENGLKTIGNVAASAMKAFLKAFDNTEGDIKSTAKDLAMSFVTNLAAGLLLGVAISQKAMQKIATTLKNGAAAVQAAGAYISRGFAMGMLSCMNVIESAAARMAAAADRAVRAKARIHSPSRVAAQLGAYWGSGYAGGLLDSIREVKQAANRLVSIPNVAAPDLAMAYSGAMSADYEYYRNAEYTIVVPVEIDGREVARTTAPYTESELNKRQQREERKNGRR